MLLVHTLLQVGCISRNYVGASCNHELMKSAETRSCEIFASVVSDGARGTYVQVSGVECSGPKITLWMGIRDAHPRRLREIDDGDMFLYGPEPSASGFPDDPVVPTRGRVIDTAGTVGDLVGSMPRAYFLVKSNAPVPSSAVGALPRRCVLCMCTALCMGRRSNVPLVMLSARVVNGDGDGTESRGGKLQR